MSKIFDPSILEELRELERDSGQEIVTEMVQEYIASVPNDLEKMKVALQASQLEELAQVAHTLKSSSANVGAVQFSLLASKIEEKIVREKMKDTETLKILLSSLEEILNPTLEHLKAA